MPFNIQRVPRGLNDLLSAFGGATPTELEDRLRATVDCTQLYGLTQRQVITRTAAALPQNSFVSIAGQDPVIVERWAVLYAATAIVVRTATMTALRFGVKVVRGGGSASTFVHVDGSPFAATDLGTSEAPFVAPYPILLPPPWDIRGFLNTVGTDATVALTISCEVGVLG